MTPEEIALSLRKLSGNISDRKETISRLSTIVSILSREDHKVTLIGPFQEQSDDALRRGFEEIEIHDLDIQSPDPDEFAGPDHSLTIKVTFKNDPDLSVSEFEVIAIDELMLDSEEDRKTVTAELFSWISLREEFFISHEEEDISEEF